MIRIDYGHKNGQKGDKFDGKKYLVKRLIRSGKKLDTYLINDVWIISYESFDYEKKKG